MNLIGNCCISSFWLKKHKLQYKNPFTWCEVPFNSMYKIITDFNNIKWERYIMGRKPCNWNNNVNYYYLTTDDDIQIIYPHYLFDAEKTTPIKIGENVYYQRIWEFIKNKYDQRIARMTEEPTFLLEWEYFDYDDIALKKILDTDLKYKVVIITNSKNYKDIIKNNLLIIYDEHKKGPEGYFPATFATIHDKTISEFLLN